MPGDDLIATFLTAQRAFAERVHAVAENQWARPTPDPHLEVWRRYWQRVGTSPRTGIWHETYLVRAGEYEAVYGNMAPFGLARASRMVPVSESSRARGRLRATAGSGTPE